MSESESMAVWSWDHDTGFALYCLGIPTDDIGAACGVSGQAIRQCAAKEDWETRAEKVAVARAARITKGNSTEQQFVRGVECQYARRLFGLAEQELRLYKPGKATLLDITRLLDLASRLGRLGSGLPLNQVEVTQTYDLGENLMAAIERAYAPQPKPAITLPPNEDPPKP